MAPPPSVRVRSLSFAELEPGTAYRLWQLRQDVFVVEQACAYADLDGRDPEPGTRHLVLEVGQQLAGCVRILDDGALLQVGRVVLARAFRGQGLADVLMRAAMTEVGDRPSMLNAQAPLAGWYAGFGYRVSGPEFLDDGIPHLPMHRP